MIQCHREKDRMERYAWKAVLKDGKLEEYQKRHNEIWQEMKDTLTEAGIVTSRREGKKTIYALNKEAVGRYRRQADQIFQDNSGNESC